VSLDSPPGEEESRLVTVASGGRNGMHTVIRRYQGVQDSAEVSRRAVEEFGPQLRDQPGFQGYWVVDAGGGVLATITVFETEEAAVESTAAAATWVQEHMPNLVPNAPQVPAGATTGVMAEVPA
jgi:heme-degrading monooxygenase HmoA